MLDFTVTSSLIFSLKVIKLFSEISLRATQFDKFVSYSTE